MLAYILEFKLKQPLQLEYEVEPIELSRVTSGNSMVSQAVRQTIVEIMFHPLVKQNLFMGHTHPGTSY